MLVKKFEDFLLEKDGKGTKSDNEAWSPDKGKWYLEYTSDLEGKNKIKIDKEEIQKLLKDSEGIDNTLDWEKLYRFFKYFLGGDEKSVGEKNLEFIRKEEIQGKPLERWFKKIKVSEIKPVAKGILELYKKEIETPGKFFDDIGRFRLVSGSNVFSFKSSLEKNKEKLKEEMSGDKVKILPLNSGMIKGIHTILLESLLCIKYSNSCLVGISNLSVVEDEATRKELDSILSEKGEISKYVKSIEEKIKDKNLFGEVTGEGDKKEGNGKAYEFSKKYEKAERSERKKLLESADSIGFTLKAYNSIKDDFSKAKKSIIKAKGIADNGQITQKEWEENVKEYKKDKDALVKSGEGMRSAMYQQVKEAFGLLQSAVDNYCSGGGEENAMGQYLKVLDSIILQSTLEYDEIFTTKK
jgi:hypothetical protein